MVREKPITTARRWSCAALLVALLMPALPTVARAADPPDTFVIEVQTGGAGTVTPSGFVLVPRGGSQTFVFTPSGCLVVSDVQVDDIPVGVGDSYTFTDIQSDHLLLVQFGPRPTATSLTMTPEVGTCMIPDTLTARVTDGDAGQVQFLMNSAPVGSAPVVNGQAVLVLRPPLPSGPYTFTALYGGSTCGAPSASALVIYQVEDAMTDSVKATLTASDVWGATPITISLRLADGVQLISWIGGSVEFYDGLTPIGSNPLNQGQAQLSAMLPVGPHFLSARVVPDACLPPVLSDVVQANSFPPDEPRPTVTLAFSPIQPVMGQTVVFTATVSPLDVTGNIKFMDPGTDAVLATVPLDQGQASLSFQNLSLGNHSLKAHYDGDWFHGWAQSPVIVARVVAGSPTTLTLTADPNGVGPGQTVTLNARLIPPLNSGSVEFHDGFGWQASAPMIDGLASVSVTPTTFGGHRYGATYTDPALPAWSADSFIVEVLSPVTVPLLVSDYTPSIPGQLVTFSALLDSLTSIGTVTFYVDDVAAAVVPVSQGLARFATKAFNLGLHSIYARYSDEPTQSSNVIVQDVSTSQLPVVRVVFPNGGETVVTGTNAEIRWNMGNSFLAPFVSLELSRSTDLGWEVIAENVPNIGSYSWAVTGPGTNVGATPVRSARIRVTDPGGLVGSDASDASFLLSEPGTLSAPEARPGSFALSVPQPNPSRGGVRCDFTLPKEARVRVSVVDVTGRRVAMLADGRFESGRHRVQWDARGDRGAVPAGVYFIRGETASQTIVRRVAIAR